MRLLRGLQLTLRLLCVLEHCFDRFVACPALPFDAAAGIDLIGRGRTAGNRAANLRFVQPIADTNDHPSPPEGQCTYDMTQLRMIVNVGRNESLQNLSDVRLRLAMNVGINCALTGA